MLRGSFLQHELLRGVHHYLRGLLFSLQSSLLGMVHFSRMHYMLGICFFSLWFDILLHCSQTR